MAMQQTTAFSWKCDSCGKVITTTKNSKPSSHSDAWSYVKVDQDAGWDYHGSPWAPRLSKAVLLCGSCTEKVMQILQPE